MDKDQETNNLASTPKNSIQDSPLDYKVEETDSFWNYNLRQKENLNLQKIFEFKPKSEELIQQIEQNIKFLLKPQIDQFLKINKINVKLLKYPKIEWIPLTKQVQKVKKSNIPIDTQIYLLLNYSQNTIIHNISPQTMHQYTTYLQIDQNIKRLEVQDINFKYNFTTDLREKFKLEILKISRDVWRSQDGIIQMIELNSKYSLHNFDIIQLYSLYLFIVEQQNISHLNLEDLQKFLKDQMQKKNISLKINLYSLGIIFLQLQNKQFVKIKPTIFQKINCIQQFNLNKIQQLSYKSYQTNEYINKEKAFLCNSCLKFSSKCNCKFNNQLSQLRNLLDYCQALNYKVNGKKVIWVNDVLQYNMKFACSNKCYKNPSNYNQIKKNNIPQHLLDMQKTLKIDQDPCILAKILKLDCLSIFLLAKHKYNELREEYIKALNQIQRIKDQNALINNPYKSASLYISCCHKQDFQCEQCKCEIFCSKYCDCPTNQCLKKFRGCNCKDRCSSDGRCSCRKDNMECDPLICKCCSTDSNFICSNTQILINNVKPTLLARSTVCNGLGLFSKQFIMKGELIIFYIGEVLIDDEDEIRDQFDDTFSFYNYQLSDERYSLDSRFCGNESRFINHNSLNLNNCRTNQIFTCGQYQLAIYAIKNIDPEQEILLNYNEGESLNKEIHNWNEQQQQYWNYLQNTITRER
ncbi:unnamed protein product [Paramecium pentaurelia]|uniref:Uncharacterized protein n=1 Tax=Paramecium pentaurelia TaxID=43138 RepID=A0A8S1T362_9CILI|nr:unnamed protein product [Paramecium pentaurelia]